ncbi:MAG TPA: excalibur calcium-binding domain-containing protein [Gemmatimonadaceae bacterium]|jgi:cytochrome c556|nr:excalibur calcium-binding domain-containing protein [Gemmatimonadaceae bacterium]
MPIPKFKPVANASEGSKKIIKPILIGLLAILAGAFGLEATNNDWDLGKIVKGSSPSDAKILRDQNGNIRRDANGQIITRVTRDKNGNVVPEGTAGAKYTDEYNCADFSAQPAAQRFFDKAGGVGHDTNRLDGDKDGVACEDLPKGAKR